MTSCIDIDFFNLKYNLYEILNINENAENNIIKKNYIKLIKNYHPDRNSELEEDIYQHIILANNILLNKNLRAKYDEYIYNKNNNFIDLKNDFNKNINSIKNKSDKSFEMKLNELNKIHGYDENINNDSIIEKFIKFKSNRNEDVIIERNSELKKNNFNDKFLNYKNTNSKLIDHILEYDDNLSDLSIHVIGKNFINLNDIDKLYIEDSVICSNFSSLDKAFKLQPENIDLNKNFNLSIDEKIKLYKNDNNYSNINKKWKK
uniref:J domain-containing protein n=1 Tax=viral metagenome TaxID=1070528 RepID=A0A6C0EE41_9ZZZZ